jgi:hypothetical protein
MGNLKKHNMLEPMDIEEEKSIDVSLSPPKRLNHSFMTPQKEQLEMNQSFSGCSLFDKSIDSSVSLHSVIQKNLGDKKLLLKLEKL